MYIRDVPTEIRSSHSVSSTAAVVSAVPLIFIIFSRHHGHDMQSQTTLYLVTYLECWCGQDRVLFSEEADT